MDVLQRAGEQLEPYGRGLLSAVLGGNEAAPVLADRVLAQSVELGVDPLDYCARRLAIGEETVFERAAHWAGFAFSPVVPSRATGAPQVDRLDHLAEVRTFRTTLLDRDVTFCSPRFDDLLRLAQARAGNPELARHVCIVPARALRARLARASSEQLMIEARQRLTRRWPYASADLDLPKPLRVGFLLAFALTTLAVGAAPFYLSALLLPFIALLLLVPAGLRVAAACSPSAGETQPPPLPDTELPVYSVLVPLRDEAGMIPQLSRAMAAIDYPPEKIDIKFVVEERSAATIEAVEAVLTDPRFELIVVPDGAPHTKPKALNFAMPLVRGDYVVVYDAEDIPDRDQLRLAASQFASDPGLDCIQAELVVDNAEENWITALFGAEYAGQFGLMLPFLAQRRFPMPLGGTSNHFRTSALRELGHWDAFNVTEDADLGVRLSRLRYRTGTLRSETNEEAPITLGAWMVQRTRWIKGWMQTFIVHNRSAGRFLRDIGWRNFLFFQIYVGSLIVSSLLHTVFLVSFVIRGALGYWPRLSDPVDLAYILVMVLGYGGSFALVIAGLSRRRAWALLPQQLFLPLYWMMHSVASFRAGWQLLTRPYFWGKTMHGRTRQARSL